MTDKPTQEQIKEFWEWCGLKQTRKYDAWYDPTLPEGEPCGVFSKTDISTIDLNNLFKYAVPKVDMPVLLSYYAGVAEAILPSYFPDEEDLFSPPLSVTDKDPALALFWALWQVKC